MKFLPWRIGVFMAAAIWPLYWLYEAWIFALGPDPGKDLKGRVPFVAILAVVLVFAVVFSDPPRILLLAFLAYAASGPIQYLLRLRRNKNAE